MLLDIYFGPDEFIREDMTIGGGGIGTLTSYLCPLLEELNFDVTVYQCSHKARETVYGNSKIINVPIKPGPGCPTEKVVKHFRDIAYARSKTKRRIELFVADFFSIKNDNPLSIAVQNGLAWDASIELLTKKKIFHTPIGEKIFRYRWQLRGLERFENCHNRVAVDLYFLNWYRSFRGINLKGRVWYNPNPAPVTNWDSERESTINSGAPVRIIFARRFVPEKGTRLIAEVFKELLKLRPNITITLAGSGPDKQFFGETFGNDPRVSIISYDVHDALRIHQGHDISVTPSLCGEATCLSILEAMSAGCAVVATNLGGTITEIIDGFNGVLCWPAKDSLLEGIVNLIDRHDTRLRVQRLGWETSQKAFSNDSWRDRWKNIIHEVLDGNAKTDSTDY